MPTLRRPWRFKRKKGPVTKRNYYNSSLWRNIRLSYIVDHPLCECCLYHGRTKLVEECHHILPIYGTSNLDMQELRAYDVGNLMSLCRDHHLMLHELLKTFPKKYFDKIRDIKIEE